jgi:hypothetical protein
MANSRIHQSSRSIWLAVITSQVAVGNFDPASWNIASNCGSTKARISTIDPIATSIRIAG